MTEKKLKIWNGRWYPKKHIYVAAYSRADVIRLLDGLGIPLGRGGDSEIKNYWSEGCWGNSMKGITPERGAWIQDNYNAKPQRVIK